jgi:hypothetical protein
MTTSQPQYSYPAAAAVSGWMADTEGAGARDPDTEAAGTEAGTQYADPRYEDPEAEEQLPVFPDETGPAPAGPDNT